ncbi:hypothetical protein BV326_03741 [Pseudomonas syringae pv. actinidiae]|uniref:hypothetical protein n=1 Tax=Pseudomonas syringae TaxID=317 RepID=UPI000A249105|nr:hypothetical protein [Pseudomonas syringae]OSR68747.1 hypothetical protein BV326_03741 [Pseudomonas syringae pv. actinidiae]
MPRLLSNNAVRLFEASQESLALALICLGSPSRGDLRVESARYSPAIGLIGAAAEQALAAILVQVRGEQAMMLSPTHFKSARQILGEVRELLRAPVPAASFLTVGVTDAHAHRALVNEATQGFSMLFTQRAAGLHAGSGVSRAVTLMQALKLHSFLGLLATSTRIRPYLDRLPTPLEDVIDQSVLVDDLIQKFQHAQVSSERVTALRSLFLVFPEIPPESPEWLDAFDRSVVTPTPADIALLLGTLQNASPIRFQRLNPSGAGLNVVVRPNDPNALAIAPQHLRRAFADIPDQFAADVGIANGRLNEGRLDLPPESFLLDLCLLGPEQIPHVLGRHVLTAQEVWPFVAAALSQQGTERPYWFLVSLVDNIGGLIGQLRLAMRASTQEYFIHKTQAAIQALEAKSQGYSIGNAHELTAFTVDQFRLAENARAELAAAIERSAGTERQPDDPASVALMRVWEREVNPSQAFDAVSNIEGRASSVLFSK